MKRPTVRLGNVMELVVAAAVCLAVMRWALPREILTAPFSSGRTATMIMLYKQTRYSSSGPPQDPRPEWLSNRIFRSSAVDRIIC